MNRRISKCFYLALTNTKPNSILHLHAGCRLLFENTDSKYHKQIAHCLQELMQYAQRSYKDKYAHHAEIFVKLYDIFEIELAKNTEIQKENK